MNSEMYVCVLGECSVVLSAWVPTRRPLKHALDDLHPGAGEGGRLLSPMMKALTPNCLEGYAVITEL
jgi:hypothetical protein